MYQTNWRGYELQQSKGSLPQAPMAIAVHLASVWVPFTSEAKEAVAQYDELLKEMKLAIQECGRKLAAHLRAKAHAEGEMKRRGIFERYIPEVAGAISEILHLEKTQVEKPFYKALPTFVKVAGEPEGGAGTPPAGSPLPTTPTTDTAPTPPVPSAPPTRGSPKKPSAPAALRKKTRSEQMTLLE